MTARNSPFIIRDQADGQGVIDFDSFQPLNRLENGSFERDADGTNPPTGWLKVGADGGEVDTADKYDGLKSLFIPDANAINNGIRQSVSVKKGQYIRASVACKATSTHAQLFIYDAAGSVVLCSALHSGGGTWEILSCTYGPLAADLPNVYTYLRKIHNPGTALDMWFDQAVLEVLDVPSDEMKRQDGQLRQYARTVLKATVNYDDASPKALFTVQDGDIVTNMWVEVTTSWDGATPGTVALGDGPDGSGYAANASLFLTGLSYRLYDHDDRGGHLWDPVNSHKKDKPYTGADTIDAFIVLNDSTQGVMDVYCEILRLK